MTHVVSRPVIALNAATGTGADKVFACPGMTEFSVEVSGIVAGDEVTIQGSNGGVSWGSAATVITADGQYNIEGGSKYLRANLTAIAGGGSVTAIISGT